MNYDIITTFGRGNEQALKIIKDIAEINVSENEIVNFNFRKYSENNPFSNLVIANAIRNFKTCHSQNTTLTPDEKGYLAHLGFYHMIGANYGKELGKAHPNNNYVPITPIPFEGDFYKNIEQQGKNLAQLLQFDKELQSFLTYIFVETIRNVYEHSENDSAFVAAQKWPSYNLLEIAIADTGCGIAQSLKRKFPDENERELLRLSCLPGISACSNFSYLDKDDGWRNSGYGLYMLRRLAVAYKGSFLICSGRIALEQTSERVREFITDYKGTAIAIRINTNAELNFEETRSRILEEGEKKAKEIRGANRKASRSSGGRYF